MKIVRKNERGRHVYKVRGNPSNEYFFGITSALNIINKPYLIRWKINNPDWEKKMKHAGRIGSVVHKYCETRAKFNLNEINMNVVDALKKDNEVKNCINAFERFMRDYKPVILDAEVMLVDRNLGIGCTVDAIMKIGDEIYVVDYKTSQSINKEYKMQIVLCTELVEKFLSHGRKCIPMIIRLNKKNGRYYINKIEDRNEYDKIKMAVENLVKFYNLYNELR